MPISPKSFRERHGVCQMRSLPRTKPLNKLNKKMSLRLSLLRPPALPFPILPSHEPKHVYRPSYFQASQPKSIPSALQQSSKPSSNGTSPGLVPGVEAKCAPDTRYRYAYVENEGCPRSLKPVRRSKLGILDQQEIPPLHLHHVSPGDIMRFTATWTKLPVDVAPDFPQQARHTAEAAKIR